MKQPLYHVFKFGNTPVRQFRSDSDQPKAKFVASIIREQRNADVEQEKAKQGTLFPNSKPLPLKAADLGWLVRVETTEDGLGARVLVEQVDALSKVHNSHMIVSMVDPIATSAETVPFRKPGRELPMPEVVSKKTLKKTGNDGSK